MQRLFIKKCFLFTVRSVCHLWAEKRSKCFAYEEVETEVRKWPKQQSEDFRAADFDALVKWWDKYMNVGGGYVEK
jgi:hypothetical protein